MSSDDSAQTRTAMARLALVVLLAAVAGCRERILVGTEPAPPPLLPGASDVGPAEVADTPDAGAPEDDDSDEDDDDDGDDDDTDDDTDD